MSEDTEYSQETIDPKQFRNQAANRGYYGLESSLYHRAKVWIQDEDYPTRNFRKAHKFRLNPGNISDSSGLNYHQLGLIPEDLFILDADARTRFVRELFGHPPGGLWFSRETNFNPNDYDLPF